MRPLQRVMVHRSINRPVQLLGGDRELVLLSALAAAMLIFAVMEWWAVIAGIGLWVVGVGLLAWMGKSDPLMKEVFVRHVGYQGFYPAVAAWCGRDRQIRDWRL